MTYKQLFEKATTNTPFPYQERLATSESLPNLLDIPTGAGKTAAIMLAWLWRRRFASAEVRKATPRRLVYCLPMRVLVEQTADACRIWLENLGFHTNSDHAISIHILMGGERDNDWDLYPEKDAILIGTQDMLLSRALNRGYATSRYRWPAQYALLHSDSLWVFDETQLFGVGLKTSAQLEAFRRIYGTPFPSHSLWMSATLTEEALNTVDAREQIPSSLPKIALEDEDKKNAGLLTRLNARKTLIRFELALTEDTKKKYAKELAGQVWSIHQSRLGQTLVVLNTVAGQTHLIVI